MNKIDKLIKEKCPNGVEYRKIKQICIDNFWVMPSTPVYQQEGIPYITSKNIRNGKVSFEDIKYIAKEDFDNICNNRAIKENDFLISMIGTVGEVGIVKKEDLPLYGQNMYLLRLNLEIINLKFFYYYFTSKSVRDKLLGEKNNGNQGYLKTKNIESLTIPIPPKEVQEEIVKILDKFSELEVELEAELEAREKQYEYYRNRILNIKNVETYKMTKLFNLKNGFTPSKSNDKFWTNGTIPWFRMEDIRKNGGILNDAIQYVTKEATKGNIFQSDSIIVATSATIGVHALIKVPSLANQRFTYLVLKDEYKEKVDMKFIYYYCFLLDKYCMNNLNQGNFNSVDMNAFKKFEFKIPSLPEQQKIVSILDKFEKLTNDITEGIPAEIELRKKQYEYYRNKLLSFKEVIN